MNTPNTTAPSRIVSLQSDFGDMAGRHRSEVALTTIANAFPDYGDCWCSETFRAWLDAKGIDAESDTGWISVEACARVDEFINEQKAKEDE